MHVKMQTYSNCCKVFLDFDIFIENSIEWMGFLILDYQMLLNL